MKRTTPEQANAIIDSLGGTVAASKKFDITVASICDYRKKGISKKQIDALLGREPGLRDSIGSLMI